MQHKADYYSRRKLFDELGVTLDKIRLLRRYFDDLDRAVERNDLNLTPEDMQTMLETLPSARKIFTPFLHKIREQNWDPPPDKNKDLYKSMLSPQEQAAYEEMAVWNSAHPDDRRYLFFVTLRAPGKNYGTLKKLWIKSPNLALAKEKLLRIIEQQKMQLIKIKNEHILDAMEDMSTEEVK